MVAKEILERVAQADRERTLRAIQGLTSGAYQVTITVQDKWRVSGTVANGNGKAYSVSLGSDDFHTCSCPDFAYRHAICKHVVCLALYAIRNPQEKIQQKPLGRPGLKLARVSRRLQSPLHCGKRWTHCFANGALGGIRPRALSVADSEQCLPPEVLMLELAVVQVYASALQVELPWLNDYIHFRLSSNTLTVNLCSTPPSKQSGAARGERVPPLSLGTNKPL